MSEPKTESSPLRKAREAAGMKLGEAAAAVGTSIANLSRIERGEYRPSNELAARLASMFGLSEIQIFYPDREDAA